MDSLRFWSLFALALPAAIRTRRTAVRAAGAAGPDEGVAGDGPDLRLIGVGDSIIAGVGASTHAVGLVSRTAEALAGIEARRVCWHAVGRSGATTADIRATMLPRAPVESAEAIVISAGVNDLTRLRSPARYARDLGALLDAIEQRAPKARVAIAGIPPLHVFPALPAPLQRAFGVRGPQFDAEIRRLVAARTRVTHVPIRIEPTTAVDRAAFSPDGFHPSESSYLPFGQATADALHALVS